MVKAKAVAGGTDAADGPGGPARMPAAQWLILACCLAWAAPSLLRMAAQPGVAGQDGQYIVIIPATAWLIWREFPRDRAFVAGNPTVVLAGLVAIVAVHLLAWLVGVLFVELLMVYAAAVLMLYRHGGVALCRRLWFPLLFLLAAVPLPGSVIASATRSLKLLVAEASVAVLGDAGYEVARTGSIIFVDQYELVVEAACSGVNSIVSLIAVGLMYAYLRGRTTPARIAVLVLASLPVAVAANIVRVVMLGAMTSHWGVYILETPLHTATGLVMFVIAVFLLLLVDAVFGMFHAIAAGAGLVRRENAGASS